MADSSRDPERESETGTPLWVKVFALIFLAVVLLFLTLMFTRGPHRPGGHTSQHSSGTHKSPRSSH